jgi:hypothetical protein
LTCGAAYDDAVVPDFSRSADRPRRARRWLAVAALVAIAAACSGSGGGDGDRAKGGAEDSSTPPGEEKPPEFAFTITGTEVHAMTASAPAFPPEVASKVKAGLEAYLADGLVEPLRDGKAPAGLEQSFTAGALARLTASAPDRAAVLEDGAALKGDVRQDRANAKLTALVDPAGVVALVTAQVDVAHTVDTGDGDVAVARSGELVLVDDGGSWKVDAFDVRTSRDSA